MNIHAYKSQIENVRKIEIDYLQENVTDPTQSYLEVPQRTNLTTIRMVKFQNSKFAFSMKFQMLVV